MVFTDNDQFDEMKSPKGEMKKRKGEMKSPKGEMKKRKGEMKSLKGEMKKMFGEMKSEIAGAAEIVRDNPKNQFRVAREKTIESFSHK